MGVNIFAPPASGDSRDQTVADAPVAYVAAWTNAADTLRPDLLFGALARARDIIIGMITGIVALFAHHPEVREAIARDPELARSATQEVIRLVSSLRVVTRVSPHGGTIDGVPVAKDQRIALCFGVASHDPAVFEDPDQFRIVRRPNPHLSFGGGPHTCLGTAHVRLIARELMIEQARRVRTLDIVDAIPEAEDATYDVPGLRFKRLIVKAHA